eukprot:RCo032102
MPLSAIDRGYELSRCERVIEKELKPKLQRIVQRRDAVYEKSSNYVKLRSQIERLQANRQAELKVMVDVGSQFYMQARVDDTSLVYVDVGLGLFVGLTHSEALICISKKLDELTKQAGDLTRQAAELKFHLRIMHDAIAELATACSVTSGDR